jgi:hypothetical protein
MRVAPVALMVPRDQVRPMAIDTSALTHGHPTGQLAAAAWAEMLADVADGAKLEDTASALATEYERLENGMKPRAQSARRWTPREMDPPRRSKASAEAGPPRKRCRSRSTPALLGRHSMTRFRSPSFTAATATRPVPLQAT